MADDYLGALGGIFGTALVAKAGFGLIDMVNVEGKKLKKKRKRK